MSDSRSRPAQGAPPAGEPAGGRTAFLRFAADLLAFAGRDGFRLAILLLFGAVAEGFGILLLIPLFGVVIGGEVGGGWLGQFAQAMVQLAPGRSPIADILFLLCILALLLAARAWLILKRDVAMARLQTGFVEHQRLEIVRLLANSRWDSITRLRHGRVTHVLGSDVEACGTAAHLLLQSAVSLTIVGAQLVLAFLLAPLLALMMLAVLAAGALALRPALRRARDLGHGVNQSNLGLVVSTSEFLGGLKLALSQNLQKSFLTEFEGALRLAGQRRVEFARQRTGAQLALTAIAALVAGLVMLAGMALAAAPTTIIAFLFIMARMNGPAAQIQTGAQMIFHSLPAYGQIKALQAEFGAAQQRTAGTAELPRLERSPEVEMREVSYLHATTPEGRGVGVDRISLRIAAGSFVGLTGPSGAGKTTCADLLIGLYPPQQGQVLIGGEPLVGDFVQAWRDSISYVSQDPFLFHDSVRRNLAWARPGASTEEMWAALEMACADDLVRGLDGGLDAVLGERGTLLSGGERQRIAVARALIRKPGLLLLDEATSAIDVAGENLILQRLAELPSRPTIIMIAHREESLALCDRLIALREGRLADRQIAD